jgi:hypothetical protein
MIINNTELLKIIDSELGKINFYKKNGYIDTAQAFIPLDNNLLISVICSYDKLSTWDVYNSVFAVSVFNKKYELLELYNELEDDDMDSFDYRVSGGIWFDMSYNKIFEKCKLVSKLIG